MSRKIYNFNRDWKFHRGEVSGDEKFHNFGCRGTNAGILNGPAGKNYGDLMWRDVQLPHDYVNEGPFGEQYDMMHGYRERPAAWYRKSFTLDESFEGKQLILVFEGICVHCEIYLNGSLLERSFNGFQEIWVDITPRAYTDGRPNTLAVYVKSDPMQLWSYEGGGIYRNVWLYAKDSVHIARDGAYLYSTLKKGTENDWSANMEITLENSGETSKKADVEAVISYKGENVFSGNIGSALIESGETAVVKYTADILNPKRWDVESPELYDVEIKVLVDEKCVDEESFRTGFRTFFVDAEKGFFLNGRQLKIKGACCHQDHACVGIAVPDNVFRYRVERLKEMGANGYRCAHHMMAKAVYDACDELGLIVMDENRFFETRSENIEALKNQVRKNRNHPSIIFWSLFNEEPIQNTEEGAKIYRALRSEVEKHDRSRLFTGGMNGSNFDGAGLEMDISGKNYGLGQLDNLHSKYASQPMIGSEAIAAWASRGELKTDFEHCQCADYDIDAFDWSSTLQNQWNRTHDKKWYSGVYIWAGFDYRGEPQPFKWPAICSPHGMMDGCGFPKNEFYFAKAMFDEKPMLKVAPHWNHKDGDEVRVVVISNCDEAELFLNGESLGKKQGNLGDQPVWMVKFKAGQLSAKGYINGELVAEDSVCTAGEPSKIKIGPYFETVKNNGVDTAILTVSVTDSEGNIVPSASHMLHFEIEGDGRLLGIGNGCSVCHEMDQCPDHTVFHGLCQAIVAVNEGAEILKVTVSGEGLETAVFTPSIEKCNDVNFMDGVPNLNIGGFSMSVVTPEKPDPHMVIEENDVNSFMPLDIPTKGYQEDFFGGYRMYRSVFTLPKMKNDTGKYTIEIGSVHFEDIEIFIDGEMVHSDYTERWARAIPVRFDFDGKAGEQKELRIIIKYLCPDRYAGISLYVKFIDEK